jgi:hypothetical protein
MKPGEHKTVQTRILAYAHDIGWTFRVGVMFIQWHSELQC